MKVTSTINQKLEVATSAEFQPGDIIQLNHTRGVFLVIENDPNKSYYQTIILFTNNASYKVGQRWPLSKNWHNKLFKGSLTITVED